MNDPQECWPSSDDFEVEVSALDAESDLDAAFVEPAAQMPSPASAARKRLLVSVCALLVALLILASVPAVRGQVLSFFSGPAAPTPYTVSAVQIMPSAPQPAPGWTLAGPRYATAIAFAPSQPATGYTCGPERIGGDQTAPVIVGFTPDGGLSWETLATPASAVACQITIDPTNPQDVVLLASSCQQCSLPRVSTLYRSFDGGNHWSLWTLPLRDIIGQTPAFSYTQWVWVGSTLVLAPYLVGDNGYVELAASVAGKPFAWLNTQSLYDGAPAATISALLATSTTLYVVLGSQNCAVNCAWVAQSRDDGASWSPFKPLFHGQPVELMARGGDGRTLLGQVVNDAPPDSHIYLRSTDGGATWQMLGPRPDLLVAEVLNETPDGSIYAAFDQDPDSPTGPQGTQAALGIYVFAPGASDWQYLGLAPLGNWFTVAWNAAGHALALWGVVDSNNLSAGLERRQL